MGALHSAAWRSGFGQILVLLCGLAVFGASSSSAQQNAQAGADEKPLKLRIASLNVSGKQIELVQLKEPTPVWRHTFGSERRAEIPRQPVRFSADIVVLQGVTKLAPVRQMFPARLYHVVVSRQILQNASASREGPEVETTALAIRRESGLRIIDQAHLLHMAEPAESAVPLAAPVAARLADRKRTFWAMSIDLAQGCSEPSNTDDLNCAALKSQLDTIDHWLSEKLAAGESVIIAGRFHRALDGASLPGSLDKLSRFPSEQKLTGACKDEDEGIARSYVLGTSGPGSSAVNFDGHLELIDEKKPEYGCLLMVDVSF